MSSTLEQPYPLVFSSDSPMAKVYQTLEKVGESKITVLIEGESGTGKDAIAHWLHYHSAQKDNPFIKIDFAALPDELIESELFGYERGAFTGAVSSKLGKLELAQGGSVVLDEIVSSDQRVQSKLLNVVESKQFYRLGGTKPVQLDCRIIALSSIPLAVAVERQIFREDLFFRLNLITVQLPPLRERKNEIFQIASFLLEHLDRKYGATGARLHADCWPIFENYNFPGNLRELRNALERALLMSTNRQITTATLPSAWNTARSSTVKLPSLEEVEKNHIDEVLKHTRGKKAKAASILGISRKTLLEKRKKYGLD